MAGYWPSSFFACLWTEIKSRSINSQKTNEANTNKLNLVNKRFIIWLSGKFCLRDTAGSPKRARWLHLAHLLRITLQSGVAMTFIQETRLEKPNFSNLQKTWNQKNISLQDLLLSNTNFYSQFLELLVAQTIIFLLGGLRKQDSTVENIVVGTFLLQTKK